MSWRFMVPATSGLTNDTIPLSGKGSTVGRQRFDAGNLGRLAFAGHARRLRTAGCHYTPPLRPSWSPARHCSAAATGGKWLAAGSGMTGRASVPIVSTVGSTLPMPLHRRRQSAAGSCAAGRSRPSVRRPNTHHAVHHRGADRAVYAAAAHPSRRSGHHDRGDVAGCMFAGCASHPPVPRRYSGPIAVVVPTLKRDRQ